MTKNSAEIHYLSIDDFRIIFEQLISAQQEYSEDLPPFDTRYPDRLESIISQVQATYFGEELPLKNSLLSSYPPALFLKPIVL